MNARSFRRACLPALSLVSLLCLPSCLGMGVQGPAPITLYGQSAGAGSAGVHTVAYGDTLWSISKRYKISMSDIVAANHLSEPFALAIGQRLKMPPPRQYKVREGDTLYRIAQMFDVSLSELAKVNGLRSPYVITPGQDLILPSRVRPAPVRLASNSKASQDSKASKAPMPSQKPQTKKQAESYAKAVSRPPPRAHKSGLESPVDGRIISGFGPKKNGMYNDGVNIAAPRGAPVRAAENGVVVYVGDGLKGSGNLVLIRHDGRLMTAYAHMDKFLVKKGDVVKRGQQIGKVGSTGSVDKPQLHFEVRKGTRAIDPKKYI